jgi:hypothetical protein
VNNSAKRPFLLYEWIWDPGDCMGKWCVGAGFFGGWGLFFLPPVCCGCFGFPCFYVLRYQFLFVPACLCCCYCNATCLWPLGYL